MSSPSIICEEEKGSGEVFHSQTLEKRLLLNSKEKVLNVKGGEEEQRASELVGLRVNGNQRWPSAQRRGAGLGRVPRLSGGGCRG